MASQNRYDLIKINKLSILIERKIYKNVENTYMKWDNIPLLWRKFFLNIANNENYVNDYCSRTLNSFDRHCRDWYLYNNTQTNSSNNLDELPEYGSYWEDDDFDGEGGSDFDGEE